MTPRAPATLMVVGDVHRFWRAFDADFLARENPALTMFVGDLGDEDVEITRTLAALTLPKVVMLGNHDAWQSFQKRKATPKLREILAVLGTDHLAYEVREVPEAGISVIGARPFSWGGPSLRSPELYDELYGVHTHRSSAAKIVEAARRAEHRDLIILAHNGPLGLSQDAHDIYGKDFGKPGGDWGDRDLALALQRIETLATLADFALDVAVRDTPADAHDHCRAPARMKPTRLPIAPASRVQWRQCNANRSC